MENNVKLSAIGQFHNLPKDVQDNLNQIIEKTKNNTGLNLILAISYSSRQEITEMVKKISVKLASNEISENDINEELISSNMQTVNIPDPELLIRTSGEYRISNFLLWQISYTELFFSEVLWPDFSKEHFFEAIINFQKRERRYGKTGEQILSK
jgi:undecaprenyl diphosphate synthase